MGRLRKVFKILQYLDKFEGNSPIRINGSVYYKSAVVGRTSSWTVGMNICMS